MSASSERPSPAISTLSSSKLKNRLDVVAIGQLLCGAQMFAESLPGHGRLSLTAAVCEATDEPLLWFCARHGIRVEIALTPTKG